MDIAFSIVIFILTGVAFLIALSLSGHGSSSGLGAISGQDLEIFKRTKDRGFVRILQVILFMMILVIVGSLVAYQLIFDEQAPVEDPEVAAVAVENMIESILWTI